MHKLPVCVVFTSELYLLCDLGDCSMFLHGDLKWCGVHWNLWGVVKDLTRTGSRPKWSLYKIWIPLPVAP